jgi:hypothetical protein
VICFEAELERKRQSEQSEAEKEALAAKLKLLDEQRRTEVRHSIQLL